MKNISKRAVSSLLKILDQRELQAVEAGDRMLFGPAAKGHFSLEVYVVELRE